MLCEVFNWVSKGVMPNYGDISHHGSELKFYWSQNNCIKLKDGLLIRELQLEDRPSRRQILIPPSLRLTVMTECHNARTAGHLGRNKTSALVKRRFLWPGTHKDVELHVKKCDTCASYKTTGKVPKAGLKDFRVGIPMSVQTL